MTPLPCTWSGVFPAATTQFDAALELVESRATSGGVTIQIYRPTGRPQYARGTPD